MPTGKYNHTKRRINLVGCRFGRLTVIGNFTAIKGKSFWLCKCDCGQSKFVRASGLVHGQAKSCGCWKNELASARSKKLLTTHGKTGSREYYTHQSMMQRCFNIKSKSYKDYGGRGITICQRWLSFENFYEDMGNRPEGKTIDRIDTNGNYEPSNCKWSTPKEQQTNRRITCQTK